MKVADTRASLILALKNDKNSARWEEFVNQYYDYLHYAAYQVDSETGRFRFVPDGVDPDMDSSGRSSSSRKGRSSGTIYCPS